MMDQNWQLTPGWVVVCGRGNCGSLKGQNTIIPYISIYPQPQTQIESIPTNNTLFTVGKLHTTYFDATDLYATYLH